MFENNRIQLKHDNDYTGGYLNNDQNNEGSAVGNEYQNYLEKITSICTEIQNFVNMHSEEIVKKSDLDLGGYKIEEIIYPNKEYYSHEGKPLFDMLKEIAENQNNLNTDGLSEEEATKRKLSIDILLKIAEYTRSVGFVDNATNDNQRDIIQKYFSNEANKETDGDEKNELYKNDKFQRNFISNLTRTLEMNDYYQMIQKTDPTLGSKFRQTKEIKNLLESILNKMSNESGLDIYDTASIEEKRSIVNQVTELSYLTCVQYIKSYNK